MDSQPLISVLVPMYNVAPYIKSVLIRFNVKPIKRLKLF